MTRVIFYVNVAEPLIFLRRFLHRKVFMPQQTALIYGSEAEIDRLDSALWEGDEFLAHERLSPDAAEPADTPAAPVMLASAAPPPEYVADILIARAAEVPDFAGSFPVCVDIVGVSEENKRAGRARYRHFQEYGYGIELIDMGKK